MVSTGTGKMGRQFPVREFCQDWKSQGILLEILEKSEKLYWKTAKNTGKISEICQSKIVKTLQIWCHALNKKRTGKNTGKLQKILEVREICQSEKVGTMVESILSL